MALGPGKYDAECTAARVATDADLVALIVMGGDRGTGFSVQTSLPMELVQGALPGVLRMIADDLERDLGV